MRDDDVSVLVALLRNDPILHDRNRGTFRRAESHRYYRESHLTRSTCFCQYFVGIVESLAVTHENDRLVALSLVEREEIRGLAKRTRE